MVICFKIYFSYTMMYEIIVLKTLKIQKFYPVFVLFYPAFFMFCLSYSTSNFFQITKCFMNHHSSKYEDKRHNNPELKTTKAYQTITNREYEQPLFNVKCSDLCHNSLIKVTKKQPISGNYCHINKTSSSKWPYFLQELLFSCRHEY